jgi:hypothetical protein
MSALLQFTDPLSRVAAAPKAITQLDECLFYHSMEVPGYGPVEGQWDLRGGEVPYLGNTGLAGKRVLELGTADGFLTFYMERQGAEVVSYDLSPQFTWDAVPFARPNRRSEGNWVSAPDTYREGINRLNNAYWLCHRAFRSQATLVHGNVYAIPDEIGPVDVTTFGALLLHTRDPFAALASAVRLTRETVVVTELRSRLCSPALQWTKRFLPTRLRQPAMRFLPQWTSSEGADGWWRLSPEIVASFLGVLGFEKSDVVYHSQMYKGSAHPMFTVVAHRTVG